MRVCETTAQAAVAGVKRGFQYGKAGPPQRLSEPGFDSVLTSAPRLSFRNVRFDLSESKSW
jgi:hypothetical protein